MKIPPLYSVTECLANDEASNSMINDLRICCLVMHNEQLKSSSNLVRSKGEMKAGKEQVKKLWENPAPMARTPPWISNDDLGTEPKSPLPEVKI
jgi:hypothetical protein